MKRRLYQLFFFSTLFLISCSPGKEISFEVLQAAEFEFPEKVDSLLVLNLAYYPWVDTLSFNILNRVEKPEQYIIDTLIIASIFNGFFSIVDNSEIQELTENQYYELRGETNMNFLEPLSIESVNYLCNEFNSSQIVALEYYGLDFSREYFAIEFDYYAVLDIQRMLGWRIYERDVGMVLEDIKKDTISWNGKGGNYVIAKENLPNLVTAIRNAFWFGGESFAKKISPYWEEEVRYYYNILGGGKSDKSLDPDFLILNSASNKKQLAFKACFNLAVVNEKNGDIEGAIESLGKAAEIKPESKIVKSYMLSLEESFNRRKKVLEQISK